MGNNSNKTLDDLFTKRYPLEIICPRNFNSHLPLKRTPLRTDPTSIKLELVYSFIKTLATRRKVGSLKNLDLKWIELRIKFRSNFFYKRKS